VTVENLDASRSVFSSSLTPGHSRATLDLLTWGTGPSDTKRLSRGQVVSIDGAMEC
jgi:hypothetical protein